MAEVAAREGESHVGYVEALLGAEMEEREVRAIARLLQEARRPRMKTLDAFEFDRSGVEASQLRTLAEGDYIAGAEPILLVGEAGTGKTRVATGLCVAACRQRRRVCFATAMALVNELVEAAHANQLSRALGRWERLDLICINELGYVPLAETATAGSVPGETQQPAIATLMLDQMFAETGATRLTVCRLRGLRRMAGAEPHA